MNERRKEMKVKDGGKRKKRVVNERRQKRGKITGAGKKLNWLKKT
jgi:hypothetical protein